MTIVTMGQPGLFPWWGTFAKAVACDVVMHLDHVSWQKGGYLNRFRLDGASTSAWCTVPLRRPAMGTPITDVMVELPHDSLNGHVSALRRCIPHASEDAVALMQRVYGMDPASVSAADLAIASTEHSASYLGLSPTFLRASRLEPEGRSSQMILGLLRSIDADGYVFGPGRRGIDQHYLDVSLLQRNGIRVGLAAYAPKPRVSILQDIAIRGEAAMDGRTIVIDWLR